MKAQEAYDLAYEMNRKWLNTDVAMAMVHIKKAASEGALQCVVRASTHDIGKLELFCAKLKREGYTASWSTNSGDIKVTWMYPL